MLKVKCPNCGKEQLYDPRIIAGQTLSSKSKRCVYCGYTFKVHSNQEKSRIVNVIRKK